MTDLITLPRATVLQALEAWEYINKYGFVLADYEGPMEQAITALKAALEQLEQPEQPEQEQEPVDAEAALRFALAQRDWAFKQLQAQPDRREWRSFSDGALMGLYMDFDRKADKQWTNAEYLLRLMATVQAKLKEKNRE